MVAIEAALDNRRWLVQDVPVPFVTARNVFKASVYEGFVETFQEVLARGLRENGRLQDAFTRNSTGYDAYSYIVTPGDHGKLGFFLSQEWHDAVARVFRVEATGEVSIALHHHRPNGKNGRPHNDLNPGWFPDLPPGTKPGTVSVHDPGVNSYPSDRCYAPNITVHESIRAIALLFYMANPPWREGDGGETGLYRTVSCPAEDAVVRIPPINNSFMAFECTPWSYHGYISNGDNPRNALIMWLHRTKAEVVRRWGEHSIVGWKR